MNTEEKGLGSWTEREREELLELGHALFACPELGFQEVKSARILEDFFEKNGISFEKGLSVTGIKASIGKKGGYHIALVADMDALEVRDGENAYPFHSCGHSIQTAVMACVLKRLKERGIAEKTGGQVSFIAAPAEEFIDFETRAKLKEEGKIRYFSGKQDMISKGVFDDVDCVISMHINGDSGGPLFDINSTLAGFMVKKVIFRGKASHSGAAPHLGRNALHGASLAMDGIAYLKDQLPPEAGLKLHPVLTSCGGTVNVIPEQAVLETYIRANTLEYLLEAGEKFDRCVTHCGEALGIETEIINTTGYMPFAQSQEITEVVHRQMLELCREDQIVKNVVSGASGDIGDLGYLIPAVQFGFSGAEGRIHSAVFSVGDEENAYFRTARVAEKAVEAILSDPSLQVKNPDFQKKKEFYLREWLGENRE